MKVAFYTLGCKVNQYDTEMFKELFTRHGYEITSFNEYADIYVINTCVVTHVAERKSRQNIRKARKKNSEALIVAVGCFPQVFPYKLEEMEEVDLCLGTKNKGQIVDLVQKNEKLKWRYMKDNLDKFEDIRVKSFKKIRRTRYFLKVQEGCERFCSYCIVPYARGKLKSRPIISVIQEAREAILSGFKEIVLTGSNLGAYGKESFYKPDLADLVRAITSINLDFRIRLSSIEPMEIDKKLIGELVKNSKVCPHLHIPLQSADDKVLKMMKRPYNHKEFKRLILEIKRERPEVCLTTDVIVGFPGEKDKNFKRTKQFLHEAGFASFHVFKYSKREGTKASELDNHVKDETKEKRSSELIELEKTLNMKYKEQFLGKILHGVIEKEEGNYITALTGNYIKVYIRREEYFTSGLEKGDICIVKPYLLSKNSVLVRLVK